ncbi:hypothetical protein PQX77_010814 [Marasmius sp. AFHP31]|nr:hypothetical protein PQX77_010814 [Marasmius sp. AFHP31]
MPKLITKKPGTVCLELITSWRSTSSHNIMSTVESLLDLHENLQELAIQLSAPMDALSSGETDSVLASEPLLTLALPDQLIEDDAGISWERLDNRNETQAPKPKTVDMLAPAEKNRIRALWDRLDAAGIREVQDLLPSINQLITAIRRRTGKAEKRYSAVNALTYQLEKEKEGRASLEREVKRLRDLVDEYEEKLNPDWWKYTEEEIQAEFMDVQEAVLMGRVKGQNHCV